MAPTTKSYPSLARVSSAVNSAKKDLQNPAISSPTTLRRCATLQVYFLDYYYDLLTYLFERRNRLNKFEEFVETEDVNEDEKKKEWTRYCGRERAYLRKRRVRIRMDMFHILFKIGQGGYGAVFLVTKKDTQEVCALKQMSKATLYKYGEIDHILTERDVLTAADSPWLVKLLYAFQDEESLNLAMEFVPGGDMRTLLNSNGMLLDRHAKFYIAEMFTAVNALHELGYIHRDLKPENFLIDSTGHVKLTDFGLSKGALSPERVTSLRRKLDSIKGKQFVMRDSSEKKSYRQSLYKNSEIHYSVVGSPEYMAPEILELGESINGVETSLQAYDHRVDYWALGCILYEYLAGFPPFTSPNIEEVWYNLNHWQESLTRPIFDNESLDANFTDLAWEFIKRLITDVSSRYKLLSQVMSDPYFEGIDWANIRDMAPPFKPQLENETDPSYFDDFTNSVTVQEQYSQLEKEQRLSGRTTSYSFERSSSVDDNEGESQTNNNHSLLPPRSAFVGFTYRHRSKHFSPPGSMSSTSSNNLREEKLKLFL